MATKVSYIGDRVTASAMGLAGVRVFTPRPDSRHVWLAVEKARQDSTLVIVDQDLAALIREQLTAVTVGHPAPPVIVMPTLDRDERVRFSASRAARLALGLERRTDHGA